jgi:4-amino-4-deoxy-L-arabinose transferase-like glycosyltransferase
MLNISLFIFLFGMFLLIIAYNDVKKHNKRSLMLFILSLILINVSWFIKNIQETYGGGGGGGRGGGMYGDYNGEYDYYSQFTDRDRVVGGTVYASDEAIEEDPGLGWVN